MRILQLGPIPPEMGGSTSGGVATHVWELSEALSQRGHEVAILADNLFLTSYRIEQNKGVTIYGIPRNLKTLFLLFKDFKIFNFIKLFIYLFKTSCRQFPDIYYYLMCQHVQNTFRPDVVHVHHLEGRFPYAYHGARSKTPIVTTIHSFSSIKFLDKRKRFYAKKLIKHNLKLVKNIIVVSELLKGELISYFGEYRGKLRVLSNPVNGGKFYPIRKDTARQRLDLPLEIPIILFVGNLIRLKGVYSLINALKYLVKDLPTCKVLIVGDGKERALLEKHVNESNLTTNVEIKGSVPHSGLLYYYNAADLFVLPSMSESWGLVYMESMLCGTPVIATDHAGLSEAIIREGSGLLVPPEKPDVLCETIKKGLCLVWDKERILRFARSFTWEQKIIEFERYYSEIISRGEACEYI